MLDFLVIATRSGKRGIIEIYPKFIIKKSSDLMIRGGDFYAIWIEERGLWSTDEQDAVDLIDRELDRYAEENCKRFDDNYRVMHMWDAETGMIDTWHKYCQKQMKDQFHMLDEKLIFSNSKTGKKDYASKMLNYPLEQGEANSYDKLMSVLYSPAERHKIEWAIGSVVSGDSKRLQKFMVLYGAAGTGKSTVLNIIQQLFDGYYSVFDAKALGSSSNAFALEAFKTNPLVAIQHDGDLSRIEDNTRLNSLVSHELMTVNEKFKSTYANRFKAFLFMGTNKPVRITDAKSGLIRRLIDVSPTGDKVEPNEYKTIMKHIPFELGPIAYHCQEVYLEDPAYYDGYIPIAMLGASNDFYNYIVDSYPVFKREDGTSLKAAWEMYKTYNEEAKVSYPLSQRAFKEELKNYFHDYTERFSMEDGTRVRSYYSGFRTEKFEEQTIIDKPEPTTRLIQFDGTVSAFDKDCADCPAQYATSKETPSQKWEKVTKTLSQLDTSKLHYIAKYKDGKHAGEWTATGTQFQIPYVFKKLFSHEEITFEDMCETKSVTSAIYIDRSPDEAAAYINNPDMAIQSEDNLVLDNGHTLQFIGKVGLFTPIKSGCGGGSLVRQNTDKNGNVKYDSVVGTKDYLWMESEMVKILGKEDCIDRRYYDALVDAASTDISKYGDFEWFVSEDPYVSDTPPWFGPGEPHEEDNTPFDVR